MKNIEEILGQDLIEKLKQENAKARIGSTELQTNLHPDLQLFAKWAYRVPKGCHGFALGCDVPIVWAESIDKVLEWLDKETPQFEIRQIKLKFGNLRFYVDLKLHECLKRKHIEEVMGELEDLCFSKGLIY